MSKANQKKGPSTRLKSVICSDISQDFEKYTEGIPTDSYYCLSTEHDKITF